MSEKKPLIGFIDKNGNIVIEPQFDEVGAFSDGLARVELNVRS